MISGIMNWLDHRAGVRKLFAAMLLEGVPGGAKWRYVWGSCLAFVFSIQVVTGILLMTAYSPSSTQAWSSVHFIQYKMDFGWLIRGLHHFGSQTMMVLIALHMLQVVIAGAHLPPREVNWWLGLGLLGVTFGLSLTGYLLPWDQKGYWATRVATNISSNLPVIGSDIRNLAVGGPDYGNHTLTRFYGLHVMALPLALIALLVAHIMIFRRHGVTSAENIEGLVTSPANEHGAEPFYPRQAFYDLVACMAVFAVMLGLVWYGFAHEVEPPEGAQAESLMDYDYWAKAGQRGKGAELDAAADRDTPNYPARPEWYFLFLFQLLKYFEGPLVEVGTVYIPNGVGVLLALLPLLGYGPLRKFGHFVGILVVVALIICAGLLTGKALMDDRPEGIVFGLLKNSDPKLLKDAEEFQKSVHAAEVKAKRACQLAMAGTPVEGGHMLMRNDPFTAGQELFKTKCASCHNFTRLDSDKDMHGEYRFESMTTGTKASDLGDFGKKTWILGLLKDPLGAKHFGLVKRPLLEDGKPKKDAKNRIILQQAFDGMDEWRKDILYVRTEEKWNDAEIAAQEKDFEDIADWLIDQAKPRDQRDMKLVDLGQKAFFNGEKNKCSGCHKVEKGQPVEGKKDKWTFEKAGASTGPDLSNYASADWIRGMILSPYHRSRYGKNNLMPVFRNLDAPGAEVFLDDLRGAAKDLPNDMIQHLTDIEREMIIRWMLRDYRPVFGGAPPK